ASVVLAFCMTLSRLALKGGRSARGGGITSSRGCSACDMGLLWSVAGSEPALLLEHLLHLVEGLAELELVDLVEGQAELLELLNQLLAALGLVDGEDEARTEVDVGLLEAGVLGRVDAGRVLDPLLMQQ